MAILESTPCKYYPLHENLNEESVMKFQVTQQLLCATELARITPQAHASRVTRSPMNYGSSRTITLVSRSQKEAAQEISHI
jgi:hypothetical protein